MQQNPFDQRLSLAESNDYHVLPATEKQIQFAQQIALQTKSDLPADVRSDRQRLSRWIDQHKKTASRSRFSNYPSSKQVAFAERIASMKGRAVPPECFRDREMMSKWIDSNL